MIWNPFAVWFSDPAPDEVISKQLYVAHVSYLHHAAEAERHAALAAMFNDQRVRLYSEFPRVDALREPGDPLEAPVRPPVDEVMLLARAYAHAYASRDDADCNAAYEALKTAVAATAAS